MPQTELTGRVCAKKESGNRKESEWVSKRVCEWIIVTVSEQMNERFESSV